MRRELLAASPEPGAKIRDFFAAAATPPANRDDFDPHWPHTSRPPQASTVISPP